MSLMRFLTSGSRGLSKGAPPLGRYRLPDGRMIPEFGRARNPFTSNPLPPQETRSPEAGVTARAASTQAAPPSSVSLVNRLHRRWGPIRNLASGTWLGPLKRLGVWLYVGCRRGATRVAALRFRLPLAGRSAAPFARSMTAGPRGPVQGEFSLENVQVVRNDLTDTDYEVVCAETATASPVKHVPQTVPVVPAAAPSRPLGRLAERLFSQRSH